MVSNYNFAVVGLLSVICAEALLAFKYPLKQTTTSPTPKEIVVRLPLEYGVWMQSKGYKAGDKVMRRLERVNEGDSYGCRTITNDGIYTFYYSPSAVSLEAVLLNTKQDTRGDTYIFRMKDDNIFYPLWPQDEINLGLCPPAQWKGLIPAATPECSALYRIGVSGLQAIYKTAQVGKCKLDHHN